jgi:DNA modification methylase
MLIEEQNGNFAKPVLGAVPSVVYNEDCVEGLKRFYDNYFDLAIVDPPYGIGRSGQTETFTKNPKHKKNSSGHYGSRLQDRVKRN